MAVNNTLKAYSNMEFPLAMKRQDAFALDPSTVWPTLADAQNYAKTNPTAYVGQMLSVVVNGTATPYVIQNANGDRSRRHHLVAEQFDRRDGLRCLPDL